MSVVDEDASRRPLGATAPRAGGGTASAPPARGFWTPRRRDALTGYLFVSPQLLGVLAFVLMPVGLAVWYSLHEWNVFTQDLTFVGGDNYAAVFEDPNLGSMLRATGIFSVGVVALNLGLGLGLAVLLNRRMRGMSIFRTVFFSPVVISAVAWTLVWGLMLQDNGVINGVLALFGIDGPNWLFGPTTAMLSVIVVQVLRSVGVNVVLFLAALQGVPGEVYEAARVDGATPRQIFWRITIPLISPTMLLTGILTVISSLQAFAAIAVLTQGGPSGSTTVLVYYVYQQAFLFSKIGYGSTLALMLLSFVLLLTVLQWQLRKRWVFHEN